MKVILERTTEHGRFAELYRASGLEIDTGRWLEENGPVCSVAAWEDGRCMGAATVSFRDDRYILDYIAVTGERRGHGLGSLLVSDCLDWCRDAGCEELYLAARAPLFFETLGAEYTGGDALLEECRDCPDYGKDCRPAEMVFRL